MIAIAIHRGLQEPCVLYAEYEEDGVQMGVSAGEVETNVGEKMGKTSQAVARAATKGAGRDFWQAETSE